MRRAWIGWTAAAVGAATAGLAIERSWPRLAIGRPVTAAYGPHPAQRIDLYPAPAEASGLLFLYVHGGGWAAGSRGDGGGAKPRHFIARGHRWASAGMRLLPSADIEVQLDDLARAVAWLEARATTLGVRRDGIVLIGHSSGAHLVAMLGADPRWLGRRGVPLSAIRGVVMLDSASLDVPPLMAGAVPGTYPHHDRAFGTDRTRQHALSPQTHAGGADVRDWLIIHDASQPAGALQAERFGQALNGRATIVGIANSDHGRIAAELGYPRDPVAAATDAWAARLRAAHASARHRPVNAAHDRSRTVQRSQCEVTKRHRVL